MCGHDGIGHASGGLGIEVELKKPDLTVEENVVLPLLIGRERPDRHQDRVRELLGALGISRLRDRVPAGLSEGSPTPPRTAAC